MENYVIKRNGEYEPLQPFKIEDAIRKGFASVNVHYDDSIYLRVLELLDDKTTWQLKKYRTLLKKSYTTRGILK